MKNKLNTKNLREQKNTTIISTEESLIDIEPYFNNNYKRRDSIMENFNINNLLVQLQEAKQAKNLSAEERVNEIAKIEETVKEISELLQQLFERRAELEAEEEKYQQEQEVLNQRYQDLNDLFAPKK
jgi:hypothetical protein